MTDQAQAAEKRRRGGKRGNGEGTIRQRPNGIWEARYVDNAGTRRSVYAKTQREAVRALREALGRRDKGLPMPTGGRLTVAAFLNRWLSDVVKPNLAHSTWQSYERTVRLHIAPVIGRTPLTELTPDHVRHVVSAAQAKGSARTAGYCRVVLRAALNHALIDGSIGRNVAAGKAVKVPKVEPKQVEPMTPETARQILDAVRGDRLEALYVTALSTGCRVSELLGLTWSDVDLDARCLSVTRQLQRVDAAYVLTTTKTRAGRRDLPLTALAVDALRAHRTRQLQERLAAGPAWQDHGLVFCRANGRPLYRTHVTHHFQMLLKRAGLPHMDLHDLRHGAATLWIIDGADPKTVQELLGHETLETTMRIYTRSTEQAKRAAVDRLDSLLRAAQQG